MDSRSIRTRAGICQALAAESRLKLMDILLSSDHPMSVTDLQRRVRKLQPSVSQSLRVLRDVGLVEVEADGKWRRYAPAKGLPVQIAKDVLGIWDAGVGA